MTDEENSRVEMIVKIRFIAKLRFIGVNLCDLIGIAKYSWDYVNLSASREKWKLAYISEEQP